MGTSVLKIYQSFFKKLLHFRKKRDIILSKRMEYNPSQMDLLCEKRFLYTHMKFVL